MGILSAADPLSRHAVGVATSSPDQRISGQRLLGSKPHPAVMGTGGAALIVAPDIQ